MQVCIVIGLQKMTYMLHKVNLDYSLPVSRSKRVLSFNMHIDTCADVRVSSSHLLLWSARQLPLVWANMSNSSSSSARPEVNTNPSPTFDKMCHVTVFTARQLKGLCKACSLWFGDFFWLAVGLAAGWLVAVSTAGWFRGEGCRLTSTKFELAVELWKSENVKKTPTKNSCLRPSRKHISRCPLTCGAFVICALFNLSNLKPNRTFICTKNAKGCCSVRAVMCCMQRTSRSGWTHCLGRH